MVCTSCGTMGDPVLVRETRKVDDEGEVKVVYGKSEERKKSVQRRTKWRTNY